MESVHGEGLEVKNEQRKHEHRGKNHPRTDTVCYRSGAHTQCNDRNVMCACMCGKGNIAVNKGEQQTKSAVKMLAALNFDLQNEQRGTGWTHQDLR